YENPETGAVLPLTSNVATGETLKPFVPAFATDPVIPPFAHVITPATPLEEELPEGFDPFAHLKEVYMPQHNAVVRLFFSDLGSDWKPNIATARSS
ncbi:MAG: hypothetical protein ACYT04_96860, partial [Nostoc sp.]